MGNLKYFHIIFLLSALGHGQPIRPNLIPALTELLEAGPNHWVKLPTQPRGKYIYQRGLSGGTQEALTLLSGQAEPTSRTVSFVPNPALADLIQYRINSGYSSPLSIRGKTDFFDQVEYYHSIEMDDLANKLADPLFNSCGHNNCPVGNRWGETQQLSAGNTIDSVEMIGAFVPRPSCSSPGSKQQCLGRSVYWGASYVLFYQTLLELGISPKPNSPGFVFFQKLKNAFSDIDLNKDHLTTNLLDKVIKIYVDNGIPDFELFNDHPLFSEDEIVELFSFNQRLAEEGLLQLQSLPYPKKQLDFFIKRDCILASAIQDVPKNLLGYGENLAKGTAILLRADQFSKINNYFDYFETVKLETDL